ncbi:hypothetical protein ACFQ5N_01455 [Lutibacter holmesii]|uniref:DNA-binding protein n=1 Tax=Lutibacter holmesii TaxID=1137985 RepID=A0ABW3WK31_9FLAO
MKSRINLVIVVFCISTLFSCKDKATYSKVDNLEPVGNKTSVHKIVVNDIINVGTYMYLQVNEDAKEYWMAIPTTKIEKGATYFYSGGMEMKNFESKQLGKTFDFITFVEGVSSSEVETINSNLHQPTNSTGHKHIETEAIHIEIPENGISISNLYSNPTNFKEKEIVVRGKVVKVNKNILGKNWIHIVDGTSFENNSDLTITTSQLVKLGATVTFSGTVVLDKDFGAGYVYSLLLENGEIVQ